jgi:CheY-like chemotaxis protein
VRRILIVDDEVSGTEVLALILVGEGFEVTVAADGGQALARLDDTAPDLLIADFMLPGLNGAELVHLVRARPGCENLPVILISGVPEVALRHYGIKYQKFLRKPFKLEAFVQAVREVLASRSM